LEELMQPSTRPGRDGRRPLARVLFTILALVALVAACGGASATPAPSLGPIDLNGTSWRLIGYLSPTGTHFTVPAAVTPGATFKDGQWTGDTGCNQASGAFTQDGTSIAIGPITATKKACQDPMATVETAYLAAIATVDTAVGNQSTLLLKKSDGFTALEFVRSN
jgi:heat shock protein HslJ